MALERLRAQLSMNTDFFPQHTMGDNMIEGLAVGAMFESRRELSEKQVHRPTHAGISGTKSFGAQSVVLSGKYSDEDEGNIVVYTGTGGQKDVYRNPGPQVEDQSFDHPMNQYLLKSSLNKRPIRVIRGPSSSRYAPSQGYRYDGMYKVTAAYQDKDPESGYNVCKFRLERVPGQPPIPVSY
ncbi:PUA-like domain-containing protein [Lentinula detonsa]|uniref:PUA-like domain-containing protein n=2 Tax=Lentinula detonsa TaxID=2804962 RepID=A0A9W8NY77_9AGAR|nr:PUA-like domain-containing protein [Lentinula detonsa]